MSNTPTPPAPPAAAKPSKSSHLRRDDSALLLDAKAMAAAVNSHLSVFEEADADRSVKRIDASWLARYTSMVTAAETAVDGRAVRLGQLKAATSTERSNAQKLATAIRGVRDDISTSYPDDEGIGRAFGFGATINVKNTGALLTLAGQIAGAFGSAEWRARASAAGVTQARIEALTELRASLSGADVSQQGLFASNVGGTVHKDALMKAVSESTAYARKVAGVVLKGNGAALAAFVPARGRAAKGGKAPVKSAPALGAATTNRKKPAKGKLRERRAEVKRQAKSLVAAPAATTATAKKGAAKRKSAAKKKAAPRTKGRK